MLYPYPSFFREVAGVVVKCIAVVVTITLIFFSLNFFYELEMGVSDGTCNIAVYPIEGEIWPFYGYSNLPTIITPNMVDEFLTSAEEDPSIKAVLFEINSPGGLPAASERIGERIRSSTLPSIGLIGDIGASGGYLVAAATDHLIASPFAIVGGIGVNASYVENSKQNEEDGLTYVQLIAGKYKDAGDPNKPLSEEERSLIERDLEDVHKVFIDIISRYRSLPLEQVTALADGSTLTGSRAKESGLIDEVGGRTEARVAMATLLGIEPVDVIFCEYEVPLLPL